MRRRVPLILAVVLIAALMAPARAASPVVPGVSITTDNVTHVGYLPEVGPTVSARVVSVGQQRRLYVSSIARGLSIYDITDPAAPALLGNLNLGGWQNEDMAVSRDGKVAVLAYGDSNSYRFNLVIDTSDPSLPRVVSRTNGGDHTAECVDDACRWLYGSEGNIYDLRDISNPVTLPKTWITHAREQGVHVTGYPHKVVRDPAGYVITDSSPRVMLDIADPAAPKVVARDAQARSSDNIRYQHNNLRPRADDWVPRDPDKPEDVADPLLRPGELLLANGESNLVPRCDGRGGPFMTWNMRDWDTGRDFSLIETFRPLRNGNYLDGDPAVNALGCSGHWFDWSANGDDYLVAAAWFEHGVRFLDVDAQTGGIQEVGFFQPVNGSVGATYWIDDEHVYVTDYVRGIDILKFDRSKPPATQAELDANWTAGLSLPTLPATQAEQYVCQLRGGRVQS